MERSEGDGSEETPPHTSDSHALLDFRGRTSRTSESTVMPLDQLLVTAPAPPIQQAAVPNLYSFFPQSPTQVTTNHQRSPSESSTISLSNTSGQHISSAAAFSQSLELQKQLKKVAHLTELLNESEASVERMSDQSVVLKEEIRRLEASWDQTSNNMDYLKNILIKFFRLPAGGEKEQLVPVLTMLLKLSQDEKAIVQQISQGGSGGDAASVPAASNWSSYMPRWSGLM